MFYLSRSKGSAILTALAAATALAIGIRARAAEPLQPLQVVNAGDERFVSGGVGDHERQMLFTHLKGSDLLVSFARREDGSFLTGVDVEVRRAGSKSSTILFTTAGPYLLARLPAGHYELIASLDGWSTEQRTLDIDPGTRQRVYITLERRHTDR